MIRFGLVVWLIVNSITSWSQVRVDRLVIKSKEVFKIDNSGSLNVDSLIIEDSARIELNRSEQDNYIRARVILAGNGVVISGAGINGEPGKSGSTGKSYVTPCQSGMPGADGSSGRPGTNGVNLYFFVDVLSVSGSMMIDLSGGSGGHGGCGGNGGDGSPGTLHCNGGTGGNGGNGGNGASGGDSGNLTIGSANEASIRKLIGSSLIFRNYGGKAGLGARGGVPGYAGLGPSTQSGYRHGKDGKEGKYGAHGVRGKDGMLSFGLTQ